MKVNDKNKIKKSSGKYQNENEFNEFVVSRKSLAERYKEVKENQKAEPLSLRMFV